MARPAKFDSDQILDRAARLVSIGGPRNATIAAIARSLGAPTGSIYHRFESRDVLMAQMWVRLVKRAQEGFVEKLDLPDVREAAHAAAVHIPRWCRDHPADAAVLVLHRREDLATAWPQELGGELETLNRPLEAALRRFTGRLPGRARAARRQAVVMALVDVPYAAVRRFLVAGSPPPPSVDPLIVQVVDALVFGRPE